MPNAQSSLPYLLCLQVDSFATGVITGNTESTNGWETLLANSKNTVNAGAIIQTGTSTSFGPTSLSINGTPCALRG